MMSMFEIAIRGHELHKYLQLLQATDLDNQPRHSRITPFSFRLPVTCALCDALTTHVRLLQLLLSVGGVFVLLTDGVTPHFLAGTPELQSSENDGPPIQSASWLGDTDADVQQWLWAFQQTACSSVDSRELNDSVFTLSPMGDDDHLRNLSTVCGAPHLRFYAGTPIFSKQGTVIGVVFVVDSSTRETLSSKEKKILKTTARQCMSELEFARECAVKERWKMINEQLIRFVGSRSVRDQELEGPASLGREDQQERRKEQINDLRDVARLHNQKFSEDESVAILGANSSMDHESERFSRVQTEIGRRVKEDDIEHETRNLAAPPDNDTQHSNTQGENMYRKIFRRAAECLQEAFQADGALFVDGVIGHHGAIQPVPEVAEELQHEINQRPERHYPKESGQSDADMGRSQPDSPNHEQDQNGSTQTGSSRSYTSPEFKRGLYVQNPADVIGMSTRNSHLAPKTNVADGVVVALANLPRGEIPLIMDTYPDGNVWYIDEVTGSWFSSKNDIPVQDDSYDKHLLASTFPAVRQLLFQPMTDPVSLKRLAGCFIWSGRVSPLFSDTTDLPALSGFLHTLEAEVSRIDAAAAVKQQEAFVSSVSHELRTPLHGILGSSQLLEGTDLDPFQTGLVSTIKASSFTLNETLTSVLSYARINQFERQQHKYRQRRPPDADWSLPNKLSHPPGPDTDFKHLYESTNIALLCEEIAGVLAAGQSYNKSTDQRNVAVVVKIAYEENWNYFTEPGALRRIVLNVVGNALKYTTEGSVVIKLAAAPVAMQGTKLSKENDSRRKITLTVKDTGRGMSKDFISNRLFVPFTQEDTTSDGVGLGMSIVKSLVSLLAGEIRVESTPDKGTDITIITPMSISEPAHRELGEPAIRLAQLIASLRKENLSVLLYGFSHKVRQTFEKYLREWFNCKLLESTVDAEPDVVMVEEGNNEVTSGMERASQQNDRRTVLLSIAMTANLLAKPMRSIKGYRAWERRPYPIGPSSFGEALWACVLKLQKLRTHRGGVDSKRNPEKADHDKEDYPSRREKGLFEEDTSVSSRESAQVSVDSAHLHPIPSLGSQETPNMTIDTILPERPRFGVGGPSIDDASSGFPNLGILVVDDNVVNRRLLGAFLHNRETYEKL